MHPGFLGTQDSYPAAIASFSGITEQVQLDYLSSVAVILKDLVAHWYPLPFFGGHGFSDEITNPKKGAFIIRWLLGYP